MIGLGALVVALSVPIVLRGALLADDFIKCLDPQRVGLASSLASSFERLGAIRPVHLVEILLTTGVCQHLPFGFAIAVPLVLTLVVAVLLRNLLRDLGTPSPWPELAAGMWLLQPIGTESALWPAALHIPLGLALALVAIRLHRAGHHAWGSLAVLGAALSVEQVILALPFAVWLATPPAHRRRALGATAPLLLAVLAAFMLWPGDDPRFQASLAERLSGLTGDPAFYFQFPAIGLGIHSVPLAVSWAFPLSLGVLASGAVLGARLGPRVLPGPDRATDASFIHTSLLVGLALVMLVNIPVVLAVPRQGSPRLFAPTWLVLSALLGLVGSRASFRRRRLVGAMAGLLAAGMMLSLALSVHVRLTSAAFSEAASRSLAVGVQNGDVIAVCGVRRTVVTPAPRGSFAVHEFVYGWAAAGALEYYTGRRVTFLLAGELWDRPCPDRDSVDRLQRFSMLLQAAA